MDVVYRHVWVGWFGEAEGKGKGKERPTNGITQILPTICHCLKCACYLVFYSIYLAWRVREGKRRPWKRCANITPMMSYLCTPASTPTSGRAIDRTESVTILLHSLDARSERAIFRSMPASICSQYELKGGCTPRILRQMSHNISVPPPAAEMAS